MASSNSSDDPERFAVIGGGISGLTTAYRLTQFRPKASVDLFESSSRLGGVLHTVQNDGLLIERGADSFFDKLPWATELCIELGLREDLIPTNEGERRAFVLRGQELCPVPGGFVVMKPHKLLPLIQTPLLSWSGKLRLLREGWIAPAPAIHKTGYDESVASFATRRLGQEAFERLVQPLLAGIYTADPYQLSLAATMPEVIEAEREYGSLRAAIKAAKSNSDAQASGARYASFKTLRSGLVQLIESLENHLPEHSVHRSAKVKAIRRESSRWFIDFDDKEQQGPFHGVVVALPAPRAAELMRELDRKLSEKLNEIPYASSAVVSMSVGREQFAKQVAGFGFVVPSVENRQIVAASYSSQKFPGRAPDDHLLIRVFLGGALQPHMMDHSDEKLCEIAWQEIAGLLGISGRPQSTDIVRWQEKMPQYHVGHLQLVEEIEQRVQQISGLELAGNAYHGVGIPQCVQSGNLAARRLLNLEMTEE